MPETLSDKRLVEIAAYFDLTNPSPGRQGCSDEELAAELVGLVAEVRGLRAAAEPLLQALRYLPDVRWQQALDGLLPDGFVLTTIYETSPDTMNAKSFTAADLRRLPDALGKEVPDDAARG